MESERHLAAAPLLRLNSKPLLLSLFLKNRLCIGQCVRQHRREYEGVLFQAWPQEVQREEVEEELAQGLRSLNLQVQWVFKFFSGLYR